MHYLLYSALLSIIGHCVARLLSNPQLLVLFLRRRPLFAWTLFATAFLAAARRVSNKAAADALRDVYDSLAPACWFVCEKVARSLKVTGCWDLSCVRAFRGGEDGDVRQQRMDCMLSLLQLLVLLLLVVIFTALLTHVMAVYESRRNLARSMDLEAVEQRKTRMRKLWTAAAIVSSAARDRDTDSGRDDVTVSGPSDDDDVSKSGSSSPTTISLASPSEHGRHTPPPKTQQRTRRAAIMYTVRRCNMRVEHPQRIRASTLRDGVHSNTACWSILLRGSERRRQGVLGAAGMGEGLGDVLVLGSVALHARRVARWRVKRAVLAKRMGEVEGKLTVRGEKEI